MKESKLLAIGIIATILVVFGGAFLLTKPNPTEPTTLTEATVIAASPEMYELGDVPINGGLVTREYEIKNSSSDAVTIKRIATSCMCTKAQVEIEGQKTRQFSMEMAGDKNALVNVEIPPQSTAKVTAIFDPAAHGPQGVGAFDRTVFLTFADPVGVKQLRFNGTVVN